MYFEDFVDLYLNDIKSRIKYNTWLTKKHIVEKKIPYLDEQGNLQKPEDVNGYKFESLILDLIRLFDNCLPFEVERNKEFAPIKNKTGVDSIDSARELLKGNGITL